MREKEIGGVFEQVVPEKRCTLCGLKARKIW